MLSVPEEQELELTLSRAPAPYAQGPQPLNGRSLPWAGGDGNVNPAAADATVTGLGMPGAPGATAGWTGGGDFMLGSLRNISGYKIWLASGGHNGSDDSGSAGTGTVAADAFLTLPWPGLPFWLR